MNSQRGRNTLYRQHSPGATAVPAPPADVAGDAVALTFWNTHAPVLAAAGRLRPEHAAMFAVVALVASECQALAARVATEGPVVSTGRGTKPNPACRLLRDARRDLFQFAAHFGLTASADARLPVDPPADDDDDEGLALLRRLAVRKH